MKQATLTRVGSISLVDLQAICHSVGRDFIPHPFVLTRPSGIEILDEYLAYTAAIPERLRDGDLHDIGQWFRSYVDADIRVECVVSIVGAPRGRILAHRQGQLGFIAAQRSEDHVVEIYAVAPYDLGPAIAGSLKLTQPGRHPKAQIPEFLRQPSAPDSDDGFAIRHRDHRSNTVSLPRAKVLRYTRIQSRWQIARDWGFDRDKDLVVYVAIEGDGDYIYEPGFEYLTPMNQRDLSRRIDVLIAADVARLRTLRGG